MFGLNKQGAVGWAQHNTSCNPMHGSNGVDLHSLATTDDNTCAPVASADTIARHCITSGRVIALCVLSSRWLMVCVCTGHERTCTCGREKSHMLCKRASQSVSCTRGVHNQPTSRKRTHTRIDLAIDHTHRCTTASTVTTIPRSQLPSRLSCAEVVATRQRVLVGWLKGLARAVGT
jgi:hypothetical protein